MSTSRTRWQIQAGGREEEEVESDVRPSSKLAPGPASMAIASKRHSQGTTAKADWWCGSCRVGDGVVVVGRCNE